MNTLSPESPPLSLFPHQLTIFLVSCCFFALAAFLTRSVLLSGEGGGGKGKGRRWEDKLVISMCSCVPALIHGCTVWSLATRELFLHGATLHAANTPIATFTLIFSLSYFVVDSVVLCAFPRNNSMLLIHHVASIVDEFMALYFGHGATILLIVIFVGELSNPIHNTAFIARNYALHAKTPAAHRMHTRLMAVFAAVFAGARFVLCPSAAIFMLWKHIHGDASPNLPSWAQFIIILIPTIGMVFSWPFALEMIRETKELLAAQKIREEEIGNFNHSNKNGVKGSKKE